jgi:hypothetical protein
MKNSRRTSVVEYIFRNVEEIERRLDKEMEPDTSGENALKTTLDAEEDLSEEAKQAQMKAQDPASIFVFTKEILRQARQLKLFGRTMDNLGDGAAASGGTEIDATVLIGDARAANKSMAYEQLNKNLRPVQRYLALSLVSMTAYLPQKMTDYRNRLVGMLESYDPFTAQAMCEGVIELLGLAKNARMFTNDNVSTILVAMQSAFRDVKSAEKSLVAFGAILSKYIRPDTRLSDLDRQKAQTRVIGPLFGLLNREETTKLQRAVIYSIMRQAMVLKVVTPGAFTGAEDSGGSKKKGDKSSLHMVIDPMVHALEAVSTLTNFTDLFYELNLCYNAASVLKMICITERVEDHAMLLQLEVVSKVMKVLGVIRDFLPQFKSVKNFVLTPPGFLVNTMTGTYIDPIYKLLPYVANARLFRMLC